MNWNRQVVPGLSHQVLQFQSTSNRQLTGVEFYLDRFFATEQPGDPNILEFRAFLRALTVPPAVTEGVLVTAPPRVLVVWPKVLTIGPRRAAPPQAPGNWSSRRTSSGAFSSTWSELSSSAANIGSPDAGRASGHPRAAAAR